jgi:signal peptidase I
VAALLKIGGRTAAYIIGFVLFLLVFAYLELTYTRRVDGTSMLPTFEEGDLVVVVSVPYGDLRIGDIIVYNPPCAITGESVIHRIIGFSGSGVVTKGDNNPYSDPGPISNGPVTENCYVGKVVYAVPYIERIASLPYGTNYILAILIFIAVIYAELRGRSNTDNSEEGTSVRTSTSSSICIDE